jgi:hypothetical protein
VAWARAARPVRVQRGRLLPVARSAGLLQRTGDLVVRLLEALPRVVTEDACSVVMADGQRTAEAVFGELLAAGGRLSLDRACEIAWASATRRFWFADATGRQLEWQRRRSDADVRWLLGVGRDLGVLEMTGDAVR